MAFSAFKKNVAIFAIDSFEGFIAFDVFGLLDDESKIDRDVLIIVCRGILRKCNIGDRFSFYLLLPYETWM